MIYDYYLFKANITEFNEWCREKEMSFKKDSKKRERWRSMDSDEKHELYLKEVFATPLAEEKKRIADRLNDTNFRTFYPNSEDLHCFPKGSILIKISFTLKKPYTSRDEGEFHIIDGESFENPIVRARFTRLPIVKPSTWKGHLRFAAGRVEYQKEKKKEIMKRLFGAESEDEKKLKGRLYFFPTFFEEDPERDVITPLKRDTRTPAKGPIPIEIMKSGSKGEFYLLYVPYPKGKNFKEKQIEDDLKFLAKALKLMFYTYGFSAKKTSGFGVIEENLNEGEIWMSSPSGIKNKSFSNLNEMENKIIELLGEGDKNE